MVPYAGMDHVFFKYLDPTGSDGATTPKATVYILQVQLLGSKLLKVCCPKKKSKNNSSLTATLCMHTQVESIIQYSFHAYFL